MTELSNRRVVTAIALGVLPVGLWTVLNFMRPDLVAPMLDHVFGYVITAVELLLVSLGVLVFLVAGLQPGSGTRIGLQIAGFLLCTLPAPCSWCSSDRSCSRSCTATRPDSAHR